MQKLLCPYCDHEIKGKGKCDFCGSKVKKPVVMETSAELNGQDFANPGGRGDSVHTQGTNAQDDAYRNSGAAPYPGNSGGASSAASVQGGTGAMRNGAAAGAAAGSRAANGAAGMPRRAVLASEAVEAGKASGTMKPAGATSQRVVKIIVIVVIVNIVLQIIFSLANLL